MKTSLPSQLLVVVFSIACYMPPLYLFTDAHLLPKWYLCIGGLAVMGMLTAVVLLRDKHGCSYRLILLFFCRVFTSATTLECLWVFVCIVRDGLRQGGEVGTLGNPAELALHLSIAIPIVLILASHCKGRKWRLLYGSASVLFAFVLWLTQSRTGLICLSLYLVVYVCLVIHRRVGKKMIGENDFEAAVFIGGMEGIIEEYEMFKEFHPDVPCLPIASTGAAAKILYDEHPEEFDERLLSELSYTSLFKELLDL